MKLAKPPNHGATEIVTTGASILNIRRVENATAKHAHARNKMLNATLPMSDNYYSTACILGSMESPWIFILNESKLS